MSTDLLEQSICRRAPAYEQYRPPFLLATKLEAHLGRGGGDLRGSRDFADIVALIDGRGELAAEIHEAPVEVRRYLGATLTALVDTDRIVGSNRRRRPGSAPP